MIWIEQRDMWEQYEIPAELFPRISKEFLEEERRTNPWFEQEYHCVFMETIDSVFTFDQVDAAVSDEVEPLFGVDQC